MRIPKSRPTISALFLGCLLRAAGAQNLPADRVVEFRIHAPPDDPNSAVAFDLRLVLHAEDRLGTSIGWRISEIEFIQPGGGGTADRVWRQQAPEVNSTDGLWRVDHADPNQPQACEFVVPPLLSGTAAAVDPACADLDYAFEGSVYAPPPEGPPFPVTAALQYAFALVGEPTPFLQAEDEPVEVPNEPKPPTSGG